MCTIGGGLGLVLWRRERALYPLALGLVLYLLYTVRIGGGFMSGRFYAAPYFLATALLLHAIPLNQLRPWGLALAIALVLGLLAPHPPPFSGPGYGQKHLESFVAEHITDERAAYYAGTGLLNALTAQPGSPFPNYDWALRGRQLREWADDGISAVIKFPNIGLIGFYAGPEYHLIDHFGLGDPLLARLPARRDEPWRIGHFKRLFPEGYLETHLYGPNLIADPKLARYYDFLKTIASGDLLSAERWTAIWKMNTGQYEHLIDLQEYHRQASNGSSYSEQGAIIIKPDHFMHFSGLGDVYFGRRQYVEAARTYRQALNLDIRYIQREHPEDYLDKMAALYLQLSRALIALDQHPTARAVLTTFTRIDPKNEEVGRALQNLQAP